VSTVGEIMDDKNLPLLDRAALERLRDELDDEDVCKIFVRNFIALLPQRAENVRRTLTTGDVPRALDAVLSLKTSSQMVGAERLADLATDLERFLRGDAPHTGPASLLPRLAADNLARITRCGRQTTDLLLKYVA
jgi:HPt (histidine-containing phosphotransfer) domain-containing protein